VSAIGSLRPNEDAFPVANSVLETYAQNKICIDCHSFASLNPSSGLKHPKPYTSDYSFIFQMAE
jgi:hypothetical protein